MALNSNYGYLPSGQSTLYSSIPTGIRTQRPQFGKFMSIQVTQFGYSGPLMYPRSCSSASDTNTDLFFDSISMINNYGTSQIDKSFNSGSSYNDSYNTSDSNYYSANNSFGHGQSYGETSMMHGELRENGDLIRDNSIMFKSQNMTSSYSGSYPGMIPFPCSDTSSSVFISEPPILNPQFDASKYNSTFGVNNVAEFKGNLQKNSTFPNRSNKRKQGRRKRKQKKMTKASPWRCELCSLEFTSQTPYDMHLRGAKHAKKIKMQQTLTTVQSQVNNTNSTFPNRSNKIKQGRKKKKQKKMAITKASAWRCEQCSLEFTSQILYDTHLSGAKHAKKSKIQQASTAVQSQVNNTINPVPGTSSIIQRPLTFLLRKTWWKKKNIRLLRVYAKYKGELLSPGVDKQEVWKTITREMKKKNSKAFNKPHKYWQRYIEKLRQDYEKMKDIPASNEEMIEFKVAAKYAFQTIENPVTAVPKEGKFRWEIQQLKKHRQFERNMALLTVFTLLKDDFTIDENADSIWEKLAEKMNENFKCYEFTPAKCHVTIMFLKKQYEKVKDKNSNEIKDSGEAIFLKEAKLAFETKDHPVTFMDKKEQKEEKLQKLLAPLKAFSMYKVQFLSPDANQEELWQEIVNTHNTLCLRKKPFNAIDLCDQLIFLKSKYDKLKNSKTDISTPEGAVFFEEAKLAFESTGSEAISVDQILHDKLSQMNKEKFERYFALLKAYNIYKAEFSSSKEEDEDVWEKIYGTVRISCSLNYFSRNGCRLHFFRMKQKYERKKRDGYIISHPDAHILFEEEKLAFEPIGYTEEHEQMDLLTEINMDSV